ncbi:hypothetical protein NC652_027104 [Populus alba x Populus x berolinensis]|nr:hypothetical protein NC652_027104 [Populus alba x Populus x berolinensis]
MSEEIRVMCMSGSGTCELLKGIWSIDQHQSWASFTSRGPNAIHPSILKLRDVNILAAWSGATAPSKLYEVIAIWLSITLFLELRWLVLM